ncbi:hypothetical protein WJX73_007994 [Symbiochloris irregularis]|uniref:Structural maintenance of chromosomes protein 5 n=1 Tax=Symbiochloris irregularis TaxID=706552 RepID=A0AAW1PKB7_9CHLO
MPAASKRSLVIEDDEDTEPTPSKRACPGGYAKGAVMKVKVHNFMVYRDAEVVPGSRLNLILGPNGTGKSTLVCALCLGLAGDTKLLGRADTMSDFVLQGEAEGWIEITLSRDDNGRPITFRRQIRTRDNHSDWKIDGRAAKKDDVVKAVKGLHVQLDNLCQFLPQDKVSEFARLNPEQLLAKTQQAIGDSSLYDLHQELIAARKDLKEAEASKKVLDDQLGNAQNANQALERDVKRFEQREKLLKEVDLGENKILWSKVQQTQDEMVEQRQKLEDGKARLKEKKKEFDAAQAPRKAKQAEVERARKQTSAAQGQSKAQDDVCHKLSKALEDAEGELAAKWTELEGLQHREDQRLKEIDNARKRVNECQARLDRVTEEVQQYNGLSPEELQQLGRERTEKEVLIRGLEGEVDDIRREGDAAGRERTRLSARLARLRDMRMARLRWLDSKNRGMQNFCEWLAQNQNRFRQHVYGPVLTEMSVADPQHQRFVEGQLGYSVLSRFVTQNQGDQQLLQQEMERKNLRVAVTNWPGNAQQVLSHPKGDASKYASYGVTHTLDEVIEAPNIIKHVLNDGHNISTAYVGSRNCDHKRLLKEQTLVTNLWTPTDHYTVFGSAYNADARGETVNGVNNNPNGPLGIGGGASEEAEVRELEQQIASIDQTMLEQEAKVRQKQSDVRAAEAESEALRKRITKAQEERRELTKRKGKVQTDLDKLKRALEAKERSKSFLDEEPKIRQAIAGKNVNAARDVAKLVKAMQELQDLITKHVLADLQQRELMWQKFSMDDAIKGQEQALIELQSAMEMLHALVEQTRNALKDARAAAEDKTGKMNDELKAAFADLPTSIPQLEEWIAQKKQAADEIVCSNPGVMAEYTKRKKQIADLEAQGGSVQDKVDLHRSVIAERRARWAPELVRITAAINENFSANFCDIACAGEVGLGIQGQEDAGPLDFDDPGLEYDKMAIHIRVKFRDNEPMQLLTPLRQSGGERALTTMLYLIAIQGVTVCPFRVVDEINQGMDQIYERQVFKLLSIAAGRPGTPQCFMLTPKLLNNLPFSPEVKVLSIFNGPHLQKVERPFSKAQLLGTRARPVQAAA